MPFGFSSSILSLPAGKFYLQIKMLYTISENWRTARLSLLKGYGFFAREKPHASSNLKHPSTILFSSTFLGKCSLQNGFHFLTKFTDNVKNIRRKNVAWLPNLCLIPGSDTDLTVTQIWTDFSGLNAVTLFLHLYYTLFIFYIRMTINCSPSRSLGSTAELIYHSLGWSQHSSNTEFPSCAEHRHFRIRSRCHSYILKTDLLPKYVIELNFI